MLIVISNLLLLYLVVQGTILMKVATTIRCTLNWNKRCNSDYKISVYQCSIMYLVSWNYILSWRWSSRNNSHNLSQPLINKLSNSHKLRYLIHWNKRLLLTLGSYWISWNISKIFISLSSRIRNDINKLYIKR